jgi:hypothetical protein
MRFPAKIWKVEDTLGFHFLTFPKGTLSSQRKKHLKEKMSESKGKNMFYFRISSPLSSLHERISRGGHGLPKVLLALAKPYPSTACGRLPLKWPYDRLIEVNPSPYGSALRTTSP